MAKWLVTGGAGFIGSHLVERLVTDGETVRVLDNFTTGNRENLAGVQGKFELIEGDLRDAEACGRAVEGIDYVLHEAALPSVPRSVEQPVESTNINVMGTVQLLHSAVQAGVKRVVYAASSSAYGDQEAKYKSEDMIPEVLSPYAAAKLAGEHFCKAFGASFGLETVCLRYFNVFGPRQDPNSLYSAVIPRFISLMLEGKRPVVYGDGKQSRDFTYIENVVEANLLAARAESKCIGQTYNIAGGASVDLLELVAMINDALGTELDPDFQPARKGDVRHSLADISRAKEDLGFNLKVDFAEGLRRTIESLR